MSHSTPKDSSGNTAVATSDVAAALIGGADASSVYEMYEVGAISPKGAFLIGQLHLEVNEECLIELRFGNASTIRVRARVKERDTANRSGMVISFVGLSEAVRNTLAQLASD